MIFSDPVDGQLHMPSAIFCLLSRVVVRISIRARVRMADKSRDCSIIGARVKCELRNCEWVFCELKCEPAGDWSAIFRITRSLPGANAIAHNRNFRTGNKTCILTHTTRVDAMYGYD